MKSASVYCVPTYYDEEEYMNLFSKEDLDNIWDAIQENKRLAGQGQQGTPAKEFFSQWKKSSDTK